MTKAREDIGSARESTTAGAKLEEIARIIEPNAMFELKNCVRSQVALAKARAILALSTPHESGGGWRPMEMAPTNGTPVIAVGRWQDATAGYPRMVHWHTGAWRDVGRVRGEALVCWAWIPRPEIWPDEPLPAPPGQGGEG